MSEPIEPPTRNMGDIISSNMNIFSSGLVASKDPSEDMAFIPLFENILNRDTMPTNETIVAIPSITMIARLK